jgi:hypothetical protein
MPFALTGQIGGMIVDQSGRRNFWRSRRGFSSRYGHDPYRHNRRCRPLGGLERSFRPRADHDRSERHHQLCSEANYDASRPLPVGSTCAWAR